MADERYVGDGPVSKEKAVWRVMQIAMVAWRIRGVCLQGSCEVLARPVWRMALVATDAPVHNQARVHIGHETNALFLASWVQQNVASGRVWWQSRASS